MSYYENLPIYRKSLDLTVYFENIVRGFSRYHKYTVGADLRNFSREVTLLCVTAIKSSGKERVEILKDLRKKLEELKITVRVCKELKAFKNFNSFEHSVKQTEDVSRQAEGWMKKLLKRQVD